MKTRRDYKYKFSVVMPVYNVEKYLAEAIESVIQQDIGFEKKVEIILVNDGSPDNSDSICLDYQKKFPNNITYIKQKNAGLSAARNRGAAVARGKYILFLDSDDKLSLDFASQTCNFFDTNYEKIDLIATKFQLFEGSTDEHLLNFRFKTSRVINVEKDYSYIQVAGASVVFKYEIFEKGHHFDETIKRYGEDTKFVTETILDKMAYGVVSSPIYFYRQRGDQTSIMNGKYSDKKWYLETPQAIFGYLLDYSRRTKGVIPRYVQYLVAYDLQWRIKQRDQSILNEKEIKDYKAYLRNLLQQVDDTIIMEQKFAFIEYKIYMLRLKYGQQFSKKIVNSNHKVYCGDTQIYDYNNSVQDVFIVGLENHGHNFLIKGQVGGFIFPGFDFVVKYNLKEYHVKKLKDNQTNVMFFGDIVYDRNGFELLLPLKNNSVITYQIISKGYIKSLGQKLKMTESVRYARSLAYVILGKYKFIMKPNCTLVLNNRLSNRLLRKCLYILKVTQKVSSRRPV